MEELVKATVVNNYTGNSENENNMAVPENDETANEAETEDNTGGGETGKNE